MFEICTPIQLNKKGHIIPLIIKMTCLNVMFVCLSKEQFKDSSREPPQTVLSNYSKMLKRERVLDIFRNSKKLLLTEKERGMRAMWLFISQQAKLPVAPQPSNDWGLKSELSWSISGACLLIF